MDLQRIGTLLVALTVVSGCAGQERSEDPGRAERRQDPYRSALREIRRDYGFSLDPSLTFLAPPSGSLAMTEEQRGDRLFSIDMGKVIRKGDRISRIDHDQVGDPIAFARLARERAGTTVALEIERKAAEPIGALLTMVTAEPELKVFNWSIPGPPAEAQARGAQPETQPREPKPQPREVKPQPREVKPQPREAQPVLASRGRVFVLIVGINDYAHKDMTDLRFAEADARAVYRFYAQDRASPADSDRVTILLGAEATQRAVLRAIDTQLVRKATRPEDTAVLFFAGHGVQDAEATYLACHDSEPGGLDYSAVSVARLQSYWSKIRAKQRVLITDACHSGALAGLRGFGGVGRRVVERATKGGETSNSVVIAAASASQLSTEDKRAGQGVFTGLLVQGLRGSADADRDGTVSASELKTWLEAEVPSRAAELGGKQDPVVKITGAELPLSTPKK